jgi:hypothetical protein
MLQRLSTSLTTYSEILFTRDLVDTLNSYLNDPSRPVPGFSGAIFETVIRGGEVSNYNGKHVEKRPDIVFRLVGENRIIEYRSQYGVFTECKVIEDVAGVRKYCNDGILRFVNGDYAWAMSHAMMLAYARDGYSVDPHLLATLTAAPKTYRVETMPAADPNSPAGHPTIFVSTHGRVWRYPRSKHGPGKILIRHLWLEVPTAKPGRKQKP